MRENNYIGKQRAVLLPIGFPFFFLKKNWEGRWVYHPQVLKKDNMFYLFYSGKTGYTMRHYIGVAVSKNLYEWQRLSENPIFSPSTNKNDWDSDLVAHSFIVKVNKEYYMFYDGSPRSSWKEGIGVAKSKDLLHWERINENPVLKAGNFWWDKKHVSRCCVIRIADDYYMFYAGHDGITERIGIAKGKDLVTWDKFVKEPILHLGKKGEWDERHISDPRVLKFGKLYLLFYTGYNKDAKGAIGLAFSNDLLRFVKFENNPILPFGKEKTWNQDESGRGDIAKVDNRYYLFFSGRRKQYFSIGYGEVFIDKIISDIKKQINARKL